MALTLSGTNGIVGAGFTVDNSGVSVTAGVGTFSSVQGSGANLTALPAANLTGTLPALSAASLTSIPAANIVGVCTSGFTKTGGFGKIIGQYRATSTTEYYSSSGTFQSAHAITFTPASNTSKFLIIYMPARIICQTSNDGEIRVSDGTNNSNQYRIANGGSTYKSPSLLFFHNHTGFSGSTTFTVKYRNISGGSSGHELILGDDGSGSDIVVLEIEQ